MGAPAGNRQRVWRTKDLRVTPLDHVLAQGVLLLCEAEEEDAGGLVLPGTETQSANGANNASVFKTESGSPGECNAPRPGRVPIDRLASGSF